MSTYSQFVDDDVVEKLEALARGDIELQGRGRPKRGSTTLKLKDLGITRQQAHEYRKLAQIPEEEAEAFSARCDAEGKRLSRRSLLIHFGFKNVVDDDLFLDTPLGNLAERVLAPVERIMREMDPKQRRWFVRALRQRLSSIAFMIDVADESK